MQDADGQTVESHSISAGSTTRASVPSTRGCATAAGPPTGTPRTTGAMDAFRLLSRTEGIIPAIESAHALVGAMEGWGRSWGGSALLVNLSGRGDKTWRPRPGTSASSRGRSDDHRPWCRGGPPSVLAGGPATLVGYLPVGFPSVEGSLDALGVLVEAGCDVVEVGVPYSDPSWTARSSRTPPRRCGQRRPCRRRVPATAAVGGRRASARHATGTSSSTGASTGSPAGSRHPVVPGSSRRTSSRTRRGVDRGQRRARPRPRFLWRRRPRRNGWPPVTQACRGFVYRLDDGRDGCAPRRRGRAGARRPGPRGDGPAGLRRSGRLHREAGRRAGGRCRRRHRGLGPGSHAGRSRPLADRLEQLRPLTSALAGASEGAPMSIRTQPRPRRPAGRPAPNASRASSAWARGSCSAGPDLGRCLQGRKAPDVERAVQAYRSSRWTSPGGSVALPFVEVVLGGAPRARPLHPAGRHHLDAAHARLHRRHLPGLGVG